MQTALQNFRLTLAKAKRAAGRQTEWLMSTDEGHMALTLVIAFLLPWAMFS